MSQNIDWTTNKYELDTEYVVGTFLGETIYRQTKKVSHITTGGSQEIAISNVKRFLGLGFPSYGVVGGAYFNIPRAHKDTMGNQIDYVYNLSGNKRITIRCGSGTYLDEGYATAYYTKN